MLKFFKRRKIFAIKSIFSFFCFGFIFAYAQNIKKEDRFKVWAFNDESKVGFNHVYKTALKDNIKDESLSDTENIKGLITVYLPKKEGKCPLILIVHGYAASKFSVLPLGRILASYGYAAAVFTSRKKEAPKDWIAPLSSTYELLKEKNENPEHKLYGLLDTENVGIAVHSLSGSAALYFADFMPFVKAVTAIHPYNGASGFIERIAGKNEELGDEFSEIRGAVLILTSETDVIAYPEKTYRFFKNLNKNTAACFLSFKNINHNDCLDTYRIEIFGGYHKENFSLYSYLITSWFDLFLKNEKHNLELFKKNGKRFSEIKHLLYTDTKRKHGDYPNYDSRNL